MAETGPFFPPVGPPWTSYLFSCKIGYNCHRFDNPAQKTYAEQRVIAIRFQLIVAVLSGLLVTPVIAAHGSLEMQRCMWPCFTESSGPNNTAGGDCAEAQCADASTASSRVLALKASWSLDKEPHFTNYSTAFVHGEPGSRIGMLGLFCVDNEPMVYVGDIPGDARLPIQLRVVVDENIFTVELRRKLGSALSGSASDKLLRALMSGRTARVMVQGAEGSFSLSGSHRAISQALAPCRQQSDTTSPAGLVNALPKENFLFPPKRMTNRAHETLPHHLSEGLCVNTNRKINYVLTS